ncbi:MAG: PepSY domain-containing protein [Hyphomicrobium sp.]|nr:PepSY domain-containing protein [Hyphomicrobium sp.]
MHRLHRRCTFAAALFAMLAGGFAHADDVGPETAKRLLSEGRIKPLSEILDAVRSQVAGEMLEVELELEKTGYVYELKLLRPDGKVQEIEADAASGKILKIEDDD